MMNMMTNDVDSFDLEVLLETMKTSYLNWILLGYILNNIVEGIPSCGTILHKLIQISREMICMAAFHFLQLDLNTIPITLNILCVNSSG